MALGEAKSVGGGRRRWGVCVCMYRWFICEFLYAQLRWHISGGAEKIRPRRQLLWQLSVACCLGKQTNAAASEEFVCKQTGHTANTRQLANMQTNKQTNMLTTMFCFNCVGMANVFKERVRDFHLALVFFFSGLWLKALSKFLAILELQNSK